MSTTKDLSEEVLPSETGTTTYLRKIKLFTHGRNFRSGRDKKGTREGEVTGVDEVGIYYNDKPQRPDTLGSLKR